MLPHDSIPFAARVQHWNKRLVHNPRELKERQHVDWPWELQLLGNLADDDWKNAVDDTGLGSFSDSPDPPVPLNLVAQQHAKA